MKAKTEVTIPFSTFSQLAESADFDERQRDLLYAFIVKSTDMSVETVTQAMGVEVEAVRREIDEWKASDGEMKRASRSRR